MIIESNLQKPSGERVKIALFDTYIQTIKNSIGNNLFKNFYAYFNGIKNDIARNGELSCDLYVSGILLLFGLIDRIHGTVDGCIYALEKYRWYRIKKPRIGGVIVWSSKKFRKSGEIHKHIGFYIGSGRAISNDTQKHHPTVHHWTYSGKRKVEKILWNDILSNRNKRT